MDQIVISSGRQFVEFCGKQVDPNFFMNEDLAENYEKLYYYLFNPSKSNLDPQKGIWLCGNIGSGKSFALKVMKRMIINSKLPQSERFTILTYKSLEREYQEYKNEAFDLYGSTGMQTICFDEMFYDTSPVGSNFGGKKINLTDEMLMDRYDLFVNSGIKTHVGSNLRIMRVKDLKLVDPRVADRIDEMFNEIIWHGESLRKGGING